MFKSISIKCFRGFNDFTIEPLDRVNLIAGTNDVGKTALLEAIFLLIGETNAALVAKINAVRGLDKIIGDPNNVSEWLWAPLFHEFATQETIKIKGQNSDATAHAVELKLVALASTRVSLGDQLTREARANVNGFSSRALQIDCTDASGGHRSSRMIIDKDGIRVEAATPSSYFPGYFLFARGMTPLDEDARIFGELEVEKVPYDLLDVMRIVEPRLKRISTILGMGGTVLWGDIGLGRMLPLALMGDGLARFTSIILRIANAQRGFVLIDEIENGLHHSIIKKAWAAIAEAARRFDVQIFATTHSWECIRAAQEAFTASGAYDLFLHRLDRLNDEIKAITYDQEALTAAIKAELEVR